MFSFIRHPFWHLKWFLSCLIVRKEAASLPRDVRLLPWSHNILAAMWHHVHLSLKGAVHRCGRQAQGQTRGSSLPSTHLVLCKYIRAFRLPPTHQGAWLWRPCMCKALICHQAVCHYWEPCWICRRTLPEWHSCFTQANHSTWIPRKTLAPFPVTSSSQSQLYSIRHETKGWISKFREQCPRILIRQYRSPHVTTYEPSMTSRKADKSSCYKQKIHYG